MTTEHSGRRARRVTACLSVPPGAGAVLAASLLAAVISPEVWGARAVTPFLLGSTVMGYLAGIALPQSVQGVLHPLVSCAVLGNVGAAVMGAVTRAGHYAMLEAYITKVRAPAGAQIALSFWQTRRGHPPPAWKRIILRFIQWCELGTLTSSQHKNSSG